MPLLPRQPFPLLTPQRFLAGLANLVLPRECPLCGHTLRHGESAALCPGCAADLPQLGETRCPVCAQPSAGGAVCGGCLRHAPCFDATVALWPYAYPVSSLIQALKYGGRLDLATPLAQELAASLRQAGEWDGVIPVPLHAARLRERGYNQAQELARPLARQLGHPLWDDALRRVRATPAQAGENRETRLKGVRAAFVATEQVAGRRVLLIDDVMTTGATAEACAHALKVAGARYVGVAVIARTLPR